MKIIKLSASKEAFVDNEDFEWLNQWKWSYMHPNSTHSGGYAYRYPKINGKREAIWMHRLINQTPEGMVTDHVNRNKLDNRRTNLRTVTHSQNQMNTGIRRSNNSGVKGVGWNRQFKKWRARITVDGKTRLIGDFLTLSEAAKARLQAEGIYHVTRT